MKRVKIIVYKSKKYNLFLSLLLTVFFSLVFILIFPYSGRLSYQSTCIIVTLAYSWIIVTWYRFFNSIFNSYTIFVIATYVFYFGQYFLITFGVQLNKGITIVTTYSKADNNFVALFIVTSMLMIHAGSILGAIIDKKNNEFLQNDEVKISTFEKPFDTKALKYVAVFLLTISYIPTIYILSNYIKIVLTVGYGSVFKSSLYTSGGFDNTLGFLSTFITPALIAAIIAFRKSKYLILVYLLTGVYLIMYFLSGSRYNAVLLIMAIFLIKKYFMGGIKVKEKIRYSVGGFFFIIVLSLISSIRSELHRASSFGGLLLNAVENLYQNNIVVAFLREFGFTFIATATVFMNCPVPINHVNGETYFASILRIFPNLFWDVHPVAKVSVDSVFKAFVTPYGGIGSSFIAEAYYNFGYPSIIIMPIIGWLLYKLFIMMSRSALDNDIGKGFLSIYIFSFSLFFIRSDTTPFWRNLVYFGVIPYYAYLIIRNSLNRGHVD
jgi:oligosaccharide repeat unit polymerase